MKDTITEFFFLLELAIFYKKKLSEIRKNIADVFFDAWIRKEMM
jgi:hypothetical protein